VPKNEDYIMMDELDEYYSMAWWMSTTAWLGG
jgi:hypothetical protein